MIDPNLMDCLAGRHCCKCQDDFFPIEKGAIRMNAFAVEGYVTWVVWLQKYFYDRVKTGEFGLNPQHLFWQTVN